MTLCHIERERFGGRHCTAGQYGYVPLGRHLVCCASSAIKQIWKFSVITIDVGYLV